MLRRAQEPDFDPQASRLAEEEADGRRLIPGQVVQYAAAFAGLFAVVFFFFWWSGNAIQFGAARVAERPVPTWHVLGRITNTDTGEPVRWATVRDDPAGRPPFFETTSDQSGVFELLTLAEPHQVLVEAPGYRPTRVRVGRQWFIWWPKGEEKVEIQLRAD